jgi:diguanylate cyclase (GGDEF)-like protein
MSDSVMIFANRRAHRRWLRHVLTDGDGLPVAADPEAAAVAIADLADGIGVVLTHMADHPDLPFVVCHEEDHDESCRLAVRAGAAECIRLDADGSLLRRAAIRTVSSQRAEDALLVPRLELMERIFASTSDRSLDTGAQIDEVLRLGCQRFDKQTGAVFRTRGDRSTAIHIHDLRGLLRQGAEFSLEATVGSIIAETGRALGIEDLDGTVWRTHPCRKAGTRSFIGVPIKIEGRDVGTLDFWSDRVHRAPFRDRDLQFVTALGEWIGSLLTRRYRIRELEDLVTHDRLTGLPNREAILSRLKRSVRRAELTQDYGFALLFIDLDGFNQVDASLGRPAGRILLRQVARRIREVVRVGDGVGRFSGDEFVVLVEHADLDEARTVADRIVAALTRPFRVGDRAILVGASVGVAMGTTSDSARDLVIAADEALYTAKSTGRAVVAVAAAHGD